MYFRASGNSGYCEPESLILDEFLFVLDDVAVGLAIAVNNLGYSNDRRSFLGGI